MAKIEVAQDACSQRDPAIQTYVCRIEGDAGGAFLSGQVQFQPAQESKTHIPNGERSILLIHRTLPEVLYRVLAIGLGAWRCGNDGESRDSENHVGETANAAPDSQPETSIRSDAFVSDQGTKFRWLLIRSQQIHFRPKAEVIAVFF